jgi:Flp pilus assembly protein TadD
MSAPDSSEERVLAESLKAEGNALYLKGDFENARVRYTMALEKDPRNAFLYANRAAGLLAQKQSVDDPMTACRLLTRTLF